MARGRGRTRGTTPKSKAGTPDVAKGLDTAYRDMLAEADADSSPIRTGDEGRPIKRRRVRGRLVTPEAPAPSQLDPLVTLVHKSPIGRQQGIQNQHLDPISANDEIENSSTAGPSPRQQQLAYEDDTSEESDFAWEEVELAQEAEQPILNAADRDNEQDLDLVLEEDRKHTSNQNSTARRKPLTAHEKKMRLDVHKVHFLCLLYHVHLRNHWCNDQNLHKILYRRLPKPIVSLLNPDETLPQFRQDEAFRQGLQEASNYFKDAFTITAQGMSSAHWAETPDSITTQPPPDLELPLQKPDFLDSARKMQGSRDVGAQLF
ncbi:MAG: hypothetical protein Q9173_005281, partial [Seirophora scorigena]